MGAVIASNSWGGGPSALVEDAIAYFNANGGGGLLTGGLTTFANGNSNTDCVGSSPIPRTPLFSGRYPRLLRS
jgi:hypothetical protein